MVQPVKPASVIDVARHCGVSPSTVCRALNERGDINPDTRARILKACEKLGYVRNSAASNLRRRRADWVACLMPDGDNELLIDKLHHLKLQARALDLGWRQSPYRSAEELNALLQETLAAQPAGMILKGALSKAQQKQVRKHRLPLVFYDTEDGGQDRVTLDRADGMEQAATYLLQHGCRRILLLGAARNTVRGQGYAKAHQQAGLDIDETLVDSTHFGRDLYAYGYNQIQARLQTPRDFDAIMAVNDACAIGAIRALAEAGIVVPTQVRVIGFDDITVGRYTNPPLTTIRQPIEAMAEAALGLLKARIDQPNRRREEVALKTELVVRSSA